MESAVDFSGKDVILHDRPRAEIISMSVKKLTEEEVDVDVDLEVDNPNSVPLHLEDIEFLVENVSKAAEEDEAQQSDASKTVKNNIIVKQVRHACLIQPRTTEVIKVPLQFAYRNIKTSGSTPPPSNSGNAGRIIPFTIRARLNGWETLRGVFQITIARLKQFLTVVDHRIGIGKLRSFIPPTGMVNGSYFTHISPAEVSMNLEARVKNGNPLPIEFLYTNISLESHGKVLDTRKIDHNITLGARSSRKVTIPLTIPLEHLTVDIKPGSIVPYTLKLEYWFKEKFYGMYKVSAEKSGEFPVPVKPVVKIQAATFNLDEQRQPVAKVCLKLENKNEFGLKITKLKCEIQSSSSGGVAVALNSEIIEKENPIELEAGGSGSIWLVAGSGMEGSFGSALWDVFAGDLSRHKIHSVIEAETSKFGKIMFP